MHIFIYTYIYIYLYSTYYLFWLLSLRTRGYLKMYTSLFLALEMRLAMEHSIFNGENHINGPWLT